ncbi:glycosyltransferase [Streptomyces sp. TRM 70361]|uniref:glycosyltransferase n=1 Tax=Streptomyces sp. TRM 70361 TaxID=3116553 RepID=UPI002E7C0703|nr:glycosyltransferase [Streptomyces sp. TRM 70361]MEE1939581.1 glycosyltransferase [Streptomyces sp. TRM 70361]
MAHSSDPQVCVVIPTYNRAELLRRQLTELTRQRLAPERFEVVVADDGSSDHTAEVVRSFSGRLRIGYHFQEDLGFRAAAARNGGARMATAPLLVFLDTGVLIGPDFLAEHLAEHRQDGQEHGPAAGRGGRLVLGYTYGYNPYQPFPGLAEALAASEPEDVVRAHGHEPGFQDLRARELAGFGEDLDLGRLAAPWMAVWALNMSLPTDAFHSVGGFDEDYRSWGGEDLEFGYRVHRHGMPITLSRRAWAVESPHERDLDANRASNCANAWRLWERHPEPVMELYGAMYSRNHYDPPLEYEYRRLLEWTEKARGTDVREEVAALVAEPLPDGRRPARVVVVGAGGAHPGLPGGPSYTLVDFDERLLADVPAADGTATVHAVGLRTVLESGSADLVVLTSRLRGLWERWSGDLLAEAGRLGGTVRVAFDGDAENTGNTGNTAGAAAAVDGGRP